MLGYNMAKKKNKKLPQIGVLGYLTLDELFDYIFMYINEFYTFFV